MLQWLGGLGGLSFTDLLNQLDQFGFFAYVLPFLLVFAVVYAILTQLKIFFENKGSAVIIAVAIGFLSLVGGWVPSFFQVVFPNFGIGVSLLLVALILAGAFLTDDDSTMKAFRWIFFGLGALIFIIVAFTSLNEWRNFAYGGWWWSNYGGLIIFLFVIVGVIIAITVAGKKSEGGKSPH